MPVVTIRGQLGSGVPEIGRFVANILHIEYVNREIIEQVAKKLVWTKRGIEVKEMPTSNLVGKIAEAFSHYSATSEGHSARPLLRLDE